MEGFNDRVGKVFDCLSSSSSSSSNKPWSLSDAEIERRTWNRDKTKSDDDDTILVSSSFNNLMKSINNKSEKNKKRNHNSLDDPSDDDDAVEDEDLDVRSSVGLDPTLDFEDEEDEYDKIATGTEDTDGHLLYMKDVTNHAPFLNSHHILSKKRDHDNANDNVDDDVDDDDQPLVNDVVNVKVKSILKRKSKEVEKPSAKRVRFDPACKERDTPEVDVDGFVVAEVAKSRQSGVPDYLLNPSKYTRYTFNDDDDDKRSNTEAYLDFIEQIRKSKDVGSEVEEQPAAELPASVVFIPRKKRGDAVQSGSEGEEVKEMSNGVAAVAVQQDEVSDMMQDETDVDAVSAEPPMFQKPSRQYRSKIEDEDTVC